MLSPLTVSAKSACLSCRYEPLTISIASSFNLISAYTAEIKAVSKAIEETLNTSVYDEVITVSNDDSFRYGREFARTEGALVGISSGAALAAAVEIARRPEAKGKTIVALLPDAGDRYLSTELFSD